MSPRSIRKHAVGEGEGQDWDHSSEVEIKSWECRRPRARSQPGPCVRLKFDLACEQAAVSIISAVKPP